MSMLIGVEVEQEQLTLAANSSLCCRSWSQSGAPSAGIVTPVLSRKATATTNHPGSVTVGARQLVHSATRVLVVVMVILKTAR